MRYTWIGLLLLVLVVTLIKFFIPLPATYNEVKIGYTAYSLLTTGRDANGNLPMPFFATDGNYISSLAIYPTVIAIKVFGYSLFAVRFFPYLANAGTIVLFYFLAKQYFDRLPNAVLASLLLALSPQVFYLPTYDSSVNYALLAITGTALAYLNKQPRWALGCAVLASLLNIAALPFLFGLLFVSLHKRKRSVLLLLVVGLAGVLTITSFRQYLLRTSFIANTSPSILGSQIDKRAAISRTEHSILDAQPVNLNRLAFNKPYYVVNALAATLANPFDLVRLTAPRQAAEALLQPNGLIDSLPRFYFWEIPLIILGLFPLLRQRNQLLKVWTASGLTAAFIFPGVGLVYVLPILLVAEVLCIQILTGAWPFKGRIAIYLLYGIVFTISTLSFLDVYIYHWPQWFPKYAQAQYSIWQTISAQDSQTNQVYVTDRFGEPSYYYAFYHQIAPTIFQKAVKTNSHAEEGVQRVSQIGNVHFGSFKYYESPRKPNQIWAGYAGEFVKNYNGTDKPETVDVPNGHVFATVSTIAYPDKLIGRDIWFVKTTF